MSDIFRLNTDQTMIGLNGKAAANAQVHFYDRKSGDYAPVYGDPALNVSLRQPVQADSAGVLRSIYLDDAISYRAVVVDSHNNRIREIDDVRRERAGIKVLGGVDALKHYCGEDPFVLVAAAGGCPVFYKRLSGCELPAEHLPGLVRAECGCNCHVAWQLCRSEPDICAMETAELNCDYHVLVQECGPGQNPNGTVDATGAEIPGTHESPNPCHCPDGSEAEAAPTVKKASIGALLSAGAKCLPRVCIPHDAPELALVGNAMVQGDRVPPPIDSTHGAFAACIQVDLTKFKNQEDIDFRHLRLDTIKDLNGNMAVPQLTLRNEGSCPRRYEVRALNRLNRATDPGGGKPFGGVPKVDANMQTRLGDILDPIIQPLMDGIWGVADYSSVVPWLRRFSIADSTMGPFLSGHLGATQTDYSVYKSTNGYTENDLIVDLDPGQSITVAVKYHIYWSMRADPADLKTMERLHFGTRIIARQVH